MIRTVTARRPALRVGAVSAAFLAGIMTLSLLVGAMTPAGLLVAGVQGPSIEVVTEDFGPVDNPNPGYDGQQVYALARAFPDLEAAAPHLDAPGYRATRILQSALASPAPAGDALVLTLLAIGIAGAAIGAGALADLAARHGRDPRVGYVALAGLVMPLLLTTNESLAFGLAFAAIAALDRRHIWLSAAIGVAAVLTKEAALLALVAAALGALPTQRWRVVPVVAIPAVAYLGWRTVAYGVLGGRDPGRFQLFGLLDLDPAALVFVLAVIALGLAGVWCWRDVAVLWPVALVFTAWILVFNTDILDWLAITRVVAPVVVLGATGLAGAWWSLRSAAPRPAGERLEADG